MKPVSSEVGSIADGYKNAESFSPDQNLAGLSHADIQYLKELQAEPLIGTLSLEEERERMRAGQSANLSDFPVRSETYHTASCPVHILRPLRSPALLPATFYFHGGGWTLGDLKTHTRFICELAIRSQSAVVFIEYPLAPEHPFPEPL